MLSTGEKLGEAVLRADKFMYRAKQRKNMVVISENEIVGRNSAQEILLQDKTKLTILIVDDSEMNRCFQYYYRTDSGETDTENGSV